MKIFIRVLAVGALLPASYLAWHWAVAVDLPDAPKPKTVVSQGFQDQAKIASAWLAKHRANINVPAISAAVAVNGKLVWAEAQGWADIGRRLAATPDTTFRIGSTSKAITVSLTGRLLEKGIIELDRPISAYMPGLPSHWQELTLRQLHSHTAGLPGYEENNDWVGALDSFLLWSRYDNVVDSLDQFDGSDLLFTPGEDFHYSSFDVALASAVLQSAADKPFLKLLDAEVAAPLGLSNTGADHLLDDPSGRATSYDRQGNRFYPWRGVDLSGKLAGGGLASTPADMVQLGAAYLDDSFLRPATVAMLWEPQALTNGEINEQSYALGWRSTRHSAKELGLDPSKFGEEVWTVHHGGVSKGSMAWLVVYPDFGIVIAMAINARADNFQDFAAPASRLAEIFLPHSRPQSR